MMRFFLFLVFCVVFQCTVRYLSNPYLHVTLPILHLGYSGRFTADEDDDRLCRCTLHSSTENRTGDGRASSAAAAIGERRIEKVSIWIVG